MTEQEWAEAGKMVLADRVRSLEARSKDFEAKWYQSNKDLHAAWARVDKLESIIDEGQPRLYEIIQDNEAREQALAAQVEALSNSQKLGWETATKHLNEANALAAQVKAMREAIEAAKISMFKSPEPFDPGDVELRMTAISKINDAFAFPESDAERRVAAMEAAYNAHLAEFKHLADCPKCHTSVMTLCDEWEKLMWDGCGELDYKLAALGQEGAK